MLSIPIPTPDSLPPLTGKTILVTRSVGQSSQFSERLTASGANVIEMPALEIAPPDHWDDLDNAISQLSNFHWLILTSTNAVDYFFRRLFHQGKDTIALMGVKIAVVGEKTAKSLQQQYSLKPDFIPPNFVADSLINNFPEEITGQKILFPRVESGGREILVKEFTAKGAEVVEVAAYKSCCPTNIPSVAKEALLNHQIDAITFASSKTVQFFYQLTEKVLIDKPANCLKDVCIASIGPQTSKSCQSLFGRVDVEAEEYTLDGLTQALVKWANS
jgi:uroporphyrinogen III methyltransferase / synthase